MHRIYLAAALWLPVCSLPLRAQTPPSQPADDGATRSVRLVVRNPSGLQDAAWPMVTGVPFPKGALSWPSPVTLADEDGRSIPVQARVTSTWGPGGTVRWLLLDWQQELAGDPEAACTLTWGAGSKPTPPRQAVVVREEGPDTFEVCTGPLTFQVRRDRFDFLHRAWRMAGADTARLLGPSAGAGPYFVSGDGTTFRAAHCPPDTVAVEEEGPLRAVICAKGWFASTSGERRGRYVVRIHAFAGQPFIKVLYTFIVTQQSGAARFRDIGLHVPMPARSVAFGADASGPHATAPGASVYLLQYDHDKFVVRAAGQAAPWEQRPPGRRSAGWARVTGERDVLTLAVRDLWQQFPKELEVHGDSGVTFHAWPAHGVRRPDRKVTDAMLQYLWFCHEGTVLDFAVPESYYDHDEQYTEDQYRYVRWSKKANAIGLAKTHELLLWFHEPAQADAVARRVEAWQAEPVCLADPRWMCGSGAFGRLHPVDTDRFGQVEAGLSRAFDCERRLEAHTNDYGMFNHGDGHTSWDLQRQRWSDTYRCWRAMHHGAPRVPWLLYVRSGDPKYYRHGVRNARHVMDVDICHHTEPQLEDLEWPLGKIVGALNDYKGLVHWHAGGRLLDYNCMTDFMLYYYYLTGDRRGLDVALEWGRSVKDRFRKPFGGRGGAGVTAALIELYQATNDPEYRHLADRLVAHMLDHDQNMDGTRIYSDHVTAYWPRKTGQRIPVGAFPEWENYAPWLQRYYDMTGDARAGRRIVAWADAYLAGFGDMCSLWPAKEYVNILAYAYHISGEQRFLAHGLRLLNTYVASIEDAPGTLYDGFPHLGQMSLGPGYMAQRTGTFLSALAAADGPVQPEPQPRRPFDLPFTRDRPEGRKFENVSLLLLDETDAPFRIKAAGSTRYDNRAIAVVVEAPGGREVVRSDIEVARGNFELDVPVPPDGETGVYRLTIRGEGSYWGIHAPIRTQPLLRQVYPLAGTVVRLGGCRYFFRVPEGTTAFTVKARAHAPEPARFTVHDPDGARAAGVSARPTPGRSIGIARIEPAPGHTGRTWRLEGQTGSAVIEFEAEGAGMSPHVATRAELLFVP